MFKIRQNRARGEGTIYERQENLCRPKFVSPLSSFVVTVSEGKREEFMWEVISCEKWFLLIQEQMRSYQSLNHRYFRQTVFMQTGLGDHEYYQFSLSKIKGICLRPQWNCRECDDVMKKWYVVTTNHIFTGLSISFMQYFLYSFLQSSPSAGLTHKVACWPTFVAPPCKHSIVCLEN